MKFDANRSAELLMKHLLGAAFEKNHLGENTIILKITTEKAGMDICISDHATDVPAYQIGSHETAATAYWEVAAVHIANQLDIEVSKTVKAAIRLGHQKSLRHLQARQEYEKRRRA